MKFQLQFMILLQVCVCAVCVCAVYVCTVYVCTVCVCLLLPSAWPVQMKWQWCLSSAIRLSLFLKAALGRGPLCEGPLSKDVFNHFSS